MSVALAIKNTVLFVLILLILHFVVKNVLLEKSFPRASSTQAVKSSDIGSTTTTNIVNPKTEETPTEVPSGVPSSDIVNKVQGGLDKAKEELLKFIDDDEDDDKDLNSYFINKSSTATTKPCDYNDKIGDQPLPLNTTCDSQIQKLSMAKESHLDLSPKKDVKTLKFVKEYDNESTMNGGQLFGGLEAFDAFDNKYDSPFA